MGFVRKRCLPCYLWIFLWRLQHLVNRKPIAVQHAKRWKLSERNVTTRALEPLFRIARSGLHAFPVIINFNYSKGTALFAKRETMCCCVEYAAFKLHDSAVPSLKIMQNTIDWKYPGFYVYYKEINWFLLYSLTVKVIIFDQILLKRFIFFKPQYCLPFAGRNRFISRFLINYTLCGIKIRYSLFANGKYDMAWEINSLLWLNEAKILRERIIPSALV